MLMTTGAMHMTMLQFFRTGIANFHDGDIKTQIFTGQGMIGVNGDGVIGDFSDGDGDMTAILYQSSCCISTSAIEIHSHVERTSQNDP